MKGFLTILIFISLSASSQSLPINSGGTPIGINTGGVGVQINPYFRANTVMDNGYYDGFPMISDVINKSAWGVYKFSSSHGGAGSLMLLHTSNWGQNWMEDSIKVDGSVIHSTNHSFYRYASGRMVIAYMTDTSAIRFAYNDNNDSGFTSITTVINTPTGYNIKPSPIKMQESSYGSLIFAYYKVGNGSNSNSAILMQSLDSGITFSQKCVLYTSSDTYPTNFPNSKGNEIALCETHPTGNEATSKWMAIVRPEVANDGGGYYMVYRSTDGANTWSQDLTIVSGSIVDDNGTTVSGNFSKSGLYLFLSSNSPVDMKLIGDSVYVVNGDRNITHGYGLVYLTASADSAWSNRITSWTRHPYVKMYNPGGSFLDCGYPVLFKSGIEPFVSEYQMSLLSPLPGVTRRTLIETVKLK